MTFPEQVGIMTLSNAILFPGTLLPLYIFEPRYRRLLAECLDGDRLFAVGLRRRESQLSGEEVGPYPVAGLGLVRTCVARADGTSHLVLQGLSRVRISEFVLDHPQRGFPVARIEPLESSASADLPPRASLVGAVRKLVAARAKLGAALPKEVVQSLLALENVELFTDVVGYTLLEDYHEKQVILETLDVPERLSRLLVLLEKQIDRCGLWKTVQGNTAADHVGNN